MAAPTQSKAYAYVLSKGWSHRLSDDHIILEFCPICNNSNWKCYMRFTPDKDGLWDCKVCGENGNLYQLMEFNGDKMNNVMSMRDVALAGSERDPLPNVELCAKRLFEESEDTELPALEYLVGRGFTIDVIERYKLGIENKFGKRWLVIPYFHKDKVVFAKYRSLPPDEKDFMSPKGYEAPLFNEDCLTQGMDELIFVEGEADTLALLSKGIENVVGVPGANVKKLVWINKLDRIAPKTMYLLYDNDEVGQNAAKAMAQRIGIDKVKSIVLPEFTYTDENGEEKPGKDINEWFRAGNPVESLEALKAEAKFFHVDGVQSVAEIVNEIKKDILDNGSLEPKWVFRMESMRRLVGGFEEGDVCGLMAEGKVGKTSLAIQLLDELIEDYDESGFMFCQEMRPKRLVRKWIALKTETPEKDFTTATVDAALSLAAQRNADYLFGYTNNRKIKDVCDTIRQVVRRYGVKFVVFDHLQLLCKSLEHSSQEIGMIAKEFKALAMELGIFIILIIQPNRVREGEIISARNALGSSEIEKAVDVMLCMHRERVGKVSGEEFAAMGFLETDTNFAPEVLIRADLTRFTAGGTTTIKMLGDISKFVELSYDDKREKSSLVPMNDQLDNLVAA